MDLYLLSVLLILSYDFFKCSSLWKDNRGLSISIIILGSVDSGSQMFLVSFFSEFGSLWVLVGRRTSWEDECLK